jgi:uncharacterized protein (DUF983 family)
MLLFNLFYSVLKNKCSRCHQGDVFIYKNPYALSKMFKMHKSCNHCNLNYEPEPSFYYGAMYVSYGISVGWFVMWYLLYLYVINIETITLVIILSIFIIVVSPLTLRWSRLIWLNLFFKYKKSFNKNSINS